MSRFEIYIRLVYGRPMYYPASALARQFAQLLNVKTFTPTQLTQINNLGFPHEIVADPAATVPVSA